MAESTAISISKFRKDLTNVVDAVRIRKDVVRVVQYRRETVAIVPIEIAQMLDEMGGVELVLRDYEKLKKERHPQG